MQSDLQFGDLSRYSEAFNQKPGNRLALNAVTQNGVQAVSLNRSAVNRVQHIYSNLIETPEATNQKRSGRCWLFAGLNTLRLAAMKKMNLESFELSQAYMMFWDKLEKANYFLESILDTLDEPLDGRVVMWLLENLIPDGGQWDMFINLVEKYGVVPKSVYPESHSSSQSHGMNVFVAAKLREDAAQLRKMHAQGCTMDKLEQAKDGMLNDIYRMLAIHLGEPPKSFDWEWRDKEKKFHHQEEITPQQFFKEYVGVDLDKMVCLIHAPTRDKPYNKLYTVQYLGNVVGGHPVRYLNVEMPVLKEAVKKQIVDGQAVWFGADYGKMTERELGVLDMDIYDLEGVYGFPMAMNKAGRLDYGQSKMNHAMVITGVDLDDEGHPRKWRVENSHGTENGDKGYLTMTDTWFDEYLYEVTVEKKYLPKEVQAVLDSEPVVLPPWDPFGALAR